MSVGVAGEGEEDVSEGSQDVLVHVLPVESEVAEEELVEVWCGPGVDSQRRHHLLHRTAEVAVGVGRVGGDGHRVSGSQRDRRRVHEGVGPARRGQQEAAGGDGGGNLALRGG